MSITNTGAKVGIPFFTLLLTMTLATPAFALPDSNALSVKPTPVPTIITNSSDSDKAIAFSTDSGIAVPLPDSLESCPFVRGTETTLFETAETQETDTTATDTTDKWTERLSNSSYYEFIGLQNEEVDLVLADDPVAWTAEMAGEDVQEESAPATNEVVDRAFAAMGTATYSYGACSPSYFDCSGFVSYALTGEYTRLGYTATFMGWPQTTEPEPGDVCVVHNGSEQHTGIYIGDGQMIHMSTSANIVVSDVYPSMIFVKYPGAEA